MQQGQVFVLRKRAIDGGGVWAYRYRTGGPGSRQLQQGGLLRARRGGSTRTGARISPAAEGRRQHADAEGARRGVPRATRRGTGDGRQALLAARQGAPCLRRPPPSRASLARDRGLADDDRTRPPVRGDPGAAARARSRGRLGNDRLEPGQGGVDSPQRPRTEKRPFESWAQVDEAAEQLGRATGRRSCLPPRPDYGPASGWRSSSATWTAKQESSTSVATQKRPAQEHQDRGEHFGRCRCRRTRWPL
jgi:hypothetical protein